MNRIDVAMASGKLLGHGGNKLILKDRGAGCSRQHLSREFSNLHEPRPTRDDSLHRRQRARVLELQRARPLGW